MLRTAACRISTLPYSAAETVVQMFCTSSSIRSHRINQSSIGSYLHKSLPSIASITFILQPAADSRGCSVIPVPGSRLPMQIQGPHLIGGGFLDCLFDDTSRFTYTYYTDLCIQSERNWERAHTLTHTYSLLWARKTQEVCQFVVVMLYLRHCINAHTSHDANSY